MFSTKWQTSRRQYGVVHERDVAELKPPSLKTIFAPLAVTDQSRQAIFHGGGI